MVQEIKTFIKAKDLLSAWTGRTIRARYQQSILGWLWAVVQPAASALIFTLIFTLFVPIDTGNVPYVVFSYVAMVPWTFFSASLTDMTDSLVNNMNLITKIFFPREVLPIAAMLARLLDFAVAVALLVFLMIFYRLVPSPLGWLFLPLILIIQITLIIGLGLAFAAINIFSRDIQPLLKLGIQLWFYATPIIYPASMVPPCLQTLYYTNPMAGIVQAYRAVLLENSLPGPTLAQAALISLIIFAIGLWFFKKVEYKFADLV